MPIGNRRTVAAMAVVYCSSRLTGPSNIGDNWIASDLNLIEGKLKANAQALREEIYADLTKKRPQAPRSEAGMAASMLAYDETFKDHKYGRCMVYASITGRYIKSTGEACKMATVSMNEETENDHVFIVMGDAISKGQDCSAWDDATVVCDEWISHHPKSLKYAAGNVGIYRGKQYAEELARLGYSTVIKDLYEVYRLGI